MQTSYEMFLLAAEEMSFTKAANKAYVTQQCMSSHIKRLEDLYGVLLFERMPKLTLTPAGKLLLQSLLQIQIIEKSTEKGISSIKKGASGTLTLGINTTRARILLPELFGAYHEEFPNVELSVVLDDAKRLLPLLLNGKIDMFLGVNCPSHELLRRKFIKNEKIYMLATRRLLSRYGTPPEPSPAGTLYGTADGAASGSANGTIDGSANGRVYRAAEGEVYGRKIRLSDFPGLPFVGNNNNSTFNQLVTRYLNSRNIQLRLICLISDYETQLRFCKKHLAAAFCPEIVLEQIRQYNRYQASDEQICIFSIDDLEESLKIELVTHAKALLPEFMEKFALLLEEYMGGNL